MSIKVGDLVMIVGGCCSRFANRGYVRTVDSIDDTQARAQACGCGYQTTGLVAHMSGCDFSCGWIPLPWLKKIEPLNEADEAQTEIKRPIKEAQRIKA